MARKQTDKEPNVDDYEFYLAEDLGDLDVEVDPDDATPERPPSRELRKRIAKNDAQQAAKQAAKRTPSLAERGRPPKKKMTAQEALAAATKAEAEKEAAKLRKAQGKREEAARKKKAKLAKRLARDATLQAEAKRLREEKRHADEEAEWARAAFSSSAGPGADVAGATPLQAPARATPAPTRISTEMSEAPPPEVVLADIEGAEVVQVFSDLPIAVVGPLFLSHQVRAQHDGDLALSVAFGAVREAIEERPDGVSAARVVFGAQEWAVWLDGARVLAALSPADLYLVGLEV